MYQPAHEGIGTTNSSEPEPEPSGRCVLAGLMEGHVVWTFAPCGKLAAFVCLRSAAPAGETFSSACVVIQLVMCGPVIIIKKKITSKITNKSISQKICK